MQSGESQPDVSDELAKQEADNLLLPLSTSLSWSFQIINLRDAVQGNRIMCFTGHTNNRPDTQWYRNVTCVGGTVCRRSVGYWQQS
jgi:hypothetical protein